MMDPIGMPISKTTRTGERKEMETGEQKEWTEGWMDVERLGEWSRENESSEQNWNRVDRFDLNVVPKTEPSGIDCLGGSLQMDECRIDGELRLSASSFLGTLVV